MIIIILSQHYKGEAASEHQILIAQSRSASFLKTKNNNSKANQMQKA
jgi:hypothetical protein